MPKFCSECGAEVNEEDTFCSICGFNLKGNIAAIKSPTIPTKTVVEVKKSKSKRPISITIAAILSALSSGIGIILGIIFLGLGLLGQFIISAYPNIAAIKPPDTQVVIGMSVAIILGLVFLIAGIIDGVIAYGFWKLKKWAGILGIIFSVIALLFMVMNPLSYIVIFTGIVYGLLRLIFIVLGWNSLE